MHRKFHRKKPHWYSSSKVKIFLIVVGATLTVICSQFVVPNGFQNRDNAINAWNGKLIPFEIDLSKPFDLYLSGGFPIPLSQDDVTNGFNLARFLYSANLTDDQFTIRFNGSKMFVSAVIRNSDNVTIAQIENNEWKTVDPNTLLFWDRNYNAYAFEIIASNGIPTLQVVIRGPNEIQIGGLFYTTTGKIDIAPMANGDAEIFVNPTDRQLIDAGIQTIFKYPALTDPDNLGKTNNPIYLSNDPLYRANWQIGIGITLEILGTILMAVFGTETVIVFVKERRKSRRNFDNKLGGLDPKTSSSKTNYYRKRKKKADKMKKQESERE